jgi:3-methyl-2-oxobutanoate hydroxymethyltransferase
VQGHENTLPVTIDQMLYHAEMVGRAAQRALVVVDLPFPINPRDPAEAVRQGTRVLKETRCQAVKIEGGAEHAEVIQSLVAAGIPVMAHVGLRPQAVHMMGGYRVQREEQQLLDAARAAEQAGAFSMVIECVPGSLAAKITAEVKIPTIGIGAGPQCDGQVLVLHDLIGMTSGYVPSFVQQYTNVAASIEAAVRDYCEQVRSRQFPGPEHQFS